MSLSTRGGIMVSFKLVKLGMNLLQKNGVVGKVARKVAQKKPFLPRGEMKKLLVNCQHGFVTDGKPIPNAKAKIRAVLRNPEEVASISNWKSREAGIWRAIQDPLDSTVKANPTIFKA